uniref:Uncharacterized protein n=1 Tax=Urocitellus parryii TaxID=9999 RepID=A0A8D2HXN4_UROPR
MGEPTVNISEGDGSGQPQNRESKKIQKILTRVKVVLEKSLNKTKKSTIIVFYYQSDKKRNLSQLEKNEGISFENSTDPQNT